RELTVEMAERRVQDLAWADIVMCQLETPLATVAWVLGEGRRRGRVTLLNPAPMRDEARDLVALADYLTPNETETERLSGVVVRGAESAAAAARALRSRGRGRRVQRRPRGGARRGARAPGRAALRQRDGGARVHAPRRSAVAAPAGPG